MKDHHRQEQELWHQYWRSFKTSEPRLIRVARDELIVWYSMRKNSLVQRIAWRMIGYLGLNEDCLGDLVHDGLLYSGDRNEGLVFAIEQYDPKHNVPFAAFASKYIRYAMLHGKTVRNNMGPYQIQLSKKFHRLGDTFEAEYHRRPTLSELSQFSGNSVQQLKRMEQAGLTIELNSLDQYLEGSSVEEDVERDVADKNALNPEEEMVYKENDLKLDRVKQFLNGLQGLGDENQTEVESVQRAMGKLTENEQQVLLLRFLYEKDHVQIAKQMEISVENSRVLLHRAIEKLKKNLFK